MTKESQNIEFKESWRDEYLKWICGFANAQGGTLYIGVSDNGDVCGLQDAKKLMEDIPNKIVNSMGLVADVNLYEQDGRAYIGVIIDSSNIPISYKGKYYYRSGSTMQEMNGVSLQQFILKKMGRSWDDIINERATLDDIDRKAVEYFLRKGIEAQRISESELNSSTEEVLANLRLIDDNGGIKNAAILLFGKNPLKFIPSVRFKIGRFGIDEADLMFQDVIEGNIIQMADRVLEVLQAKYLISPVRFEGMQRYESLEIPKEALREILYNAIAHKDYTGPDIQIHVYNNQIEIWNEGILPEGYDEDVLYGKHSSKPRNRNIADTMFKAGFIDMWGRGYMKIREGFEKAGMSMPKVKNFCGGVQITIERSKFLQMSDTADNKESNVTSVSLVELTDRQEKICNMIRGNSRISVKEMSLVLSLAERTIKRDIATMQKKGILVREGNTSAGHWVIIQR